MPEARFDPRVILPCIIVMIALLLAATPQRFQLSALALLVVLLALARRWAWFCGIVLAGVALMVATPAVRQLTPGWPAALLTGLMVLWSYVMAGAFGAFLVAELVPAELLAALRRYRVPPAFTVPLMVLIRYVPTLFDNARAILDAMRIRGFLRGPADILIRPLRVGRHLVVPLLAGAIRGGDDLTAAALTRGLDSGGAPTTITELRLSWWDAALVAATLAALSPLVVAP